MLDLFNDLPEHAQKHYHELARQHTKMLETSSHPFRGLRNIYKAADEANESLVGKISCKKGCAHCCHIRVSCTPLEAKMIYAYCVQHDIPIDEEKLKAVADLDQDEYMFSPQKRCTFLADDNTCKIYEVRPIMCRNHNSAIDPINCDTDVNPFAQVGSIIDWEAMMAATALIGHAGDQTHDSLPKRLLTEINK